MRRALPTLPVGSSRFFTKEYADRAVGDGVPLGAMSVFEPLGGILSANLPITYVLFANSFQRLRNTFSTRFSRISSDGSKPVTPFSQEKSMFRQDRVSDLGAGRWIHFREASHSTQSNNSDYAIVPITEGQPERVTDWNSEAQTSERELMVRL